MKLKSNQFPYPVLNNNLDDYLNSEFNAKLQIIEQTPLQITLNVQYDLQNPGIKELITNEQATYAIHVEGASSSYRKLFTPKNPSIDDFITFDLSPGDISAKMEFNPIIIATEDIVSFKNNDFNTLYYGEDFSIPNIQKGDILAFVETIELNFIFDNRENLNARSMIQIAISKDKNMHIDTNQEKIMVYLPKNDYEAYINLSKSSETRQKLLMIAVILPTLTYALERLASEEVDPSLQWVDALTDLLNENNIEVIDLTESPSKSLEYAQKLLNYPVEDSISNFYQEELSSEND